MRKVTRHNDRTQVLRKCVEPLLFAWKFCQAFADIENLFVWKFCRAFVDVEKCICLKILSSICRRWRNCCNFLPSHPPLPNISICLIFLYQTFFQFKFSCQIHQGTRLYINYMQHHSNYLKVYQGSLVPPSGSPEWVLGDEHVSCTTCASSTTCTSCTTCTLYFSHYFVTLTTCTLLLQLHVLVLEISPSMTIDHRRCVVGSSISVAVYTSNFEGWCKYNGGVCIQWWCTPQWVHWCTLLTMGCIFLCHTSQSIQRRTLPTSMDGTQQCCSTVLMCTSGSKHLSACSTARSITATWGEVVHLS